MSANATSLRAHTVVTTEDRADLVRRHLEPLTSGLIALAAVSVAVAAVAAFGSLSVNLRDDARVFATLHAIGATRIELATYVVAHSVVVGLPASLVGAGVGIAAGGLALQLSARAAAVPSPPLVIDAVGVAVVAGAVSVVLTAGVALAAASAAYRRPMAAASGVLSPARPRVALLASVGASAIAVVGVSASLSLAYRSSATTAAMAVASSAAVVCATPLAVRGLSLLASQRSQNTVSLHLGVRTPTQDLRRATALTGTIAVIAMAVVTAAGMDSSLRANTVSTADQQFDADLRIAGVGDFKRLQAGLSTHPAIQEVAAVSYATGLTVRSATRTVPFSALAVDPEEFFRIERLTWVEGSEGVARAALQRPGTIALSADLATALDVSVGDLVEVGKGEATRQAAVAGIYAGFLVAPAVVGRSTPAPSDVRPVGVIANVKPNISPEAAAVVLRDTVAAFGQLEVSTLSDIRRGQLSVIDRYTTLFVGLLGLTALMGLIAILNNVQMTVRLRARDAGIMMALGFTRRNLRRFLVAENCLLGVVAVLVGVPAGLLLSWLTVTTGSAGIAIGYAIPIEAILAVAAAIPAATAIAAALGAAALESRGLVHLMQCQ